MKICFVKTSSMGDILHALPALTEAKNVLPDLQVDWVIENNFAEIPRWHKATRRIITINMRYWRSHFLSKATWLQGKNYYQLLRKEKYDAVIDAQGLIKSALFSTMLAKGKKYGYDKNSAREPLASLFYDQTFNINYQQHAIDRIRLLMAKSLNYDLPEKIDDYGIDTHIATLKHHTIIQTGSPYILFFHATTKKQKGWVEKYWTAVADNLINQGFTIKLPWNSKTEKEYAEKIARKFKNIEILPKLSLTELAYYITQSYAVISVDTGLAHLAAALNKNNITLYGPTEPKLVGTYGKNQRIIKQNSMEHISPTEVLHAFALFN